MKNLLYYLLYSCIYSKAIDSHAKYQIKKHEYQAMYLCVIGWQNNKITISFEKYSSRKSLEKVANPDNGWLCGSQI